MPLLPLWSGIILCTVNTGNVTTDSNASVENWFRIVKHNIFDTDSRLKAADFIRSIYINIDDRIAAFKFSFSRLAGKVFKQKKRKCQVEENEEECKEEWSKRKKNKLSYIQPSKSRIDKAFKGIIKGKSNSLKTVKCRNKQIVNQVTLNTKSDCILDQNKLCKYDQDISTPMSNRIIPGKDVEIITDLDIVEMSSLDSNLPRFHPLTYSGQKQMCNLFDVKLMNSIICSRNEHPPYSNLRDYFPSKTLHIPGDGNCLFSSLAYYMTGNIDTYNRIRALIVDNMVGKLKEPCNKFIINKFPRTAINYRNVNDYVVKSKMRTNGTWGTDVELFAVALLLQTDIWIYSKVATE